MNILKFTDFVNEAFLTIKDLEKMDKEGSRGTKLLNKIKSKADFPTEKSAAKAKKEVENEISTKGNYDNDKGRERFLKPNSNRYRDDAFHIDKEGIPLNKLIKTTDLGGGISGRSNERESLHCLFLSLRQTLKRNITIKNISGIKNPQVIRNVVLPLNVKLDLLDYSHHPTYMDSFIEITNRLYEKDDRGRKILDINKKYKFIHNNSKDPLIDSIKSKYRELSLDFRGHDGKRLIIDFAKFTPADIWAISKEKYREIISKINKIKNPIDLSNLLTTYFDKRILIGISLKMIDKNHVKYIINKEDIPSFHFDRFEISEEKDSMTSYVVCNVYVKNKWYREQSFSIRGYSGESKKAYNDEIEISGSKAKQGKCSLSYVNFILEKVENEYNITLGKIPIFRNDILTAGKRKELIESCRYVLQKIDAYSNISNRISNKKLIFRYQGLYLCNILDKLNKSGFHTSNITPYTRLSNQNIRDAIITKIFNYGLSIGNEFFSSPKYIRYI